MLRPASWLALLSRTFTFELSLAGSPRANVEYNYVGKQSIPTAGLSPASPTALWAAGRVGKGRPAGSIELRVSPSPSKIPYGGFSPVRLQMDRQWRPSTISQGLSAVHIRLMIPSYTPPQFLLPEVRDPQRDFPVVEPLGSIWHDSQQLQHVHPEALGSPSGYVVPTGHRLLRPHPSLWIPLYHLWIRGRGCCTQGIRLGVGIQRFPNLLRWTVLACRLPYPGGPEECT